MDRIRIVLITFLSLITTVATFNYFDDSIDKPAPIFYDISSKIRHLPEEKFFGITTFEYEKNTKLELLLSGFGVSNAILKDNSLSLTTLKDKNLEDPLGQTSSITPCDIDGDGFNELFAINKYFKTVSGVSRNRLFKLKGSQWIDLLKYSEANESDVSIGAICLDRNNDNTFELFVIKNDQKFEYLEYKDNKLVDISKSIGINKSVKAKSAIVVPNYEGSPNIFIGVEDGPNIFFKINKDYTYTEYTEESGLADPSNDARGISLIDYNKDEIIDVVYGNYDGPLKLYLQNKDSSFKEIISKDLNQKFFISSLAVSDFNLDGTQDLYINNRSGKNYLFINKENNWHEEVLSTGLESTRVGTSVLVGDLLFDGANEILITHGYGDKSRPTLYTTKSYNKWLAILPKLKSGEIARNAMVVMRTNLKSDLRVITNGSTPYSSNIPVAHFGLKNNEEPTSFKIIYNGRTYTYPAGTFQMDQLNIIKI